MSSRLYKKWILSFLIIFIISLIIYLKVSINPKIIKKDWLKSWINNTILDSQLIYIESEKVDVNSDQSLCPFCFGIGFCKQLVDIKVLSSHSINNLYHQTSLLSSNTKIELLSLSSNKWSKYDKFSCPNAKVPCSSTSLHTQLQRPLDLPTLQKIFKHYHLSSSLSTFYKCLTQEYFDTLVKAFDNNQDNVLKIDEQLTLMTSVLVFPTYVNHMFQTQLGTDFSFSKILGACGRIVAQEGHLIPLINYTQTFPSFEVKAGLSFQLMQIIEDFLDMDDSWLLLHLRIVPSIFSVTKDGEILVSNLDDLIFIDKKLLNSHDKLKNSENILQSKVCNAACLATFEQSFTTSNQTSDCSSVDKYFGSKMWISLCTNILSSQYTNTNFGLLDSPPSTEQELIQDLIHECVHESSSGGRRNAIDELKSLLKNYVKLIEEEEDSDVKENQDDDDDEDVNNEAPRIESEHDAKEELIKEDEDEEEGNVQNV